MPGTPEFTIITPSFLAADDILEEREKVLRFLDDSKGYFTLDFKDTKDVTLDGLAQIAWMAQEIGPSRGEFQVVNVCEDAYYALMNTNIQGRRLISLAEIYTRRSELDIHDFEDELLTNADSLGLTVPIINQELMGGAYEAHKKLHGSYNKIPNHDEMMRRRAEYTIIRIQRLIEEKKAGITDQLGHEFGKVTRIKTLDQINDIVDGAKLGLDDMNRTQPYQEPDETQKHTQPLLQEGITYEGKCIDWFEIYGFIEEGTTGKNVYVHHRDINIPAPSFKELIKEDRYSFEIKHTSGKNPKGINVTPL